MSQKPMSRILTIGLAGHGKTTLLAALARHSDEYSGTSLLTLNGGESLEKQALAAASTAPITVESSYRGYLCFEGSGTTEQVKATVKKAAPIDAAILICSANDDLGETGTLLDICEQGGIKSIVVFINKIDLQDDPEKVELREMELRDLVETRHYDGHGDNFAIGSALRALKGEDDELGFKIMNILDECVRPE